ncbi:MAG TPA: hypothetical protein VLE89_08925 [Chlamydiales bacterium]|nr:hypothetical protein [Chlamydiales bacterium]
MKFRTLILSLLALSFVATLFAEEKTETPKQAQAFGHTQYGAVVLDSIQGNGLLKLNGTSVTHTLHMEGSLLSQGAHIGTLEVLGEANLTNTTIQNASFIFGSLQAVHSTFLQPITLLTQKATFTHTKLQGITVQKDQGYKGKQVLELRQNTLVDGPIHFESGKGEVLLYPGSHVIGKVTGGKVIKKN